MLGQLLAIAANTFFESIRQPILLVVLVAYSVAVIICAPLSGFTMEDDQRMLIDLGLATIFLSGALLAAFIATSVLTREIENRTALTVVSKPVGRPLFVIGKYLGVSGALLLGTLFMALVFVLVERHGVLQTVRDKVHAPTVVFGLGAGALGLGAAVWCNYFYGKVFSSSVIAFTTPLLGLAYVFSLMFRHDFTPQSPAEGFHGQVWIAVAGLSVAILILAAIAVAASTRLSQVMTLVITIGLFLAGMLSDHVIGRPIRAYEQAWAARAAARPDAEAQRFVDEQVDPQDLGAWVAAVRREEAWAREQATLNEAQREVTLARRQGRESPREEVEGRIAAIWQQWHAESTARWATTLDGLERAARQHEPSGADLVLRIDEPQIIHLQTGDAQVNLARSIRVYPPFVRAQASAGERIAYGCLRAAYAVLPNFQVLLLSDSVTQLHVVPLGYLGRACAYGAICIVISLAAGTILFQRREVG